MNKIIKKIILTITMVVVLFSSTSNLALAADNATWYNQSYPEWFTKVYDQKNPQEIFGERYTNAQVQWVIYGLFTWVLTGGSGSNAELYSCAISADAAGCIKGVVDKIFPRAQKLEKSNVGSVLSFIGSQPISGVGYLVNTAKNLRIVPEAKAQGFGFQAASPVLSLWRVARNISYSLLTLAVVIMAFMIMFRVKINPQTVITVQSALPKVIAALILITFSYAIAGLLIDLMYVILGLVTSLITTAGNLTNLNWSQLMTIVVQQKNVFDLLWDFSLLFILISFYNIFTFSGVAGFFIFLFSIIAFVILLWYEIKTVFMMLQTFAQIILGIISAPFQILFGTVVSGAGFGKWLKSMASSLVVYPLVFLFTFLAHFFLIQAIPSKIAGTDPNQFAQLSTYDIKMEVIRGNAWDPPLTFGVTWEANIIWLVVAYAIIILVPKTVKIIQGFMAGRLDIETMIGEQAGGRTVEGIGRGFGASTLSYVAEKGAFPGLLGKIFKKPVGEFGKKVAGTGARMLGGH